jgi:hypothetical protein
MSKEQHFLMRAEEMATLYTSDFTKKEAILTGKRMVDNLLESGDIDKMKFGSNLVRLNDVISSAINTFRDNIIDCEKQTINGVEFNPVNGGETLNYKDDLVYLQLYEQLKEREELLKIAYKSKNELYDSEGVEVPKVSSTPRKSSITIKY